MFTSWMGTKMTDGLFELYAEDLLALTREQFNDFRWADKIRMMHCTALSSGPITAPFPIPYPFEQEDEQPRSKSFQIICQGM